MKKLLGVLSILLGVLGGIGIMLFAPIYGIWHIITVFQDLTFWQFLWDIVLISGGEIIGCIVLIVFGSLGFYFIEKKSKYRKTYFRKR